MNQCHPQINSGIVVTMNAEEVLLVKPKKDANVGKKCTAQKLLREKIISNLSLERLGGKE